MKSSSVAQADGKLLGSIDHPVLVSPNAKIIGMIHSSQTWKIFYYTLCCYKNKSILCRIYNVFLANVRASLCFKITAII